MCSIYICRVHHRATALDVFNKWHVAFHGTRVDSVNAILECGDLLIPGISCNIYILIKQRNQRVDIYHVHSIIMMLFALSHDNS